MENGKSISVKDERIDKICDLIIKYTQANFTARESLSEKGDELDAIIVGLNTLGEELQAKNKEKAEFEARMNFMMDNLLRYTLMDFSKKMEISPLGDELDAISVGINTLVEELQASGKVVIQFQERVNNIMNGLLKYTLMDFSEKMKVSPLGDELDAITVGINTLVEELVSAKEADEENIRKLEKKADEILHLNTALETNVNKLEIVNKELEAFTYSVSHDLRTPLRAIHSYTKILSDEYLSHVDADGKQMMEAVMRNAKRMGQLIDDLLAFSKVGKKELQMAVIDMQKLAESTINDIKSSVESWKAKITVHSLPPGVGDYSLMGQVFMNLISNAVKYSSAKEKPEVEIGCKEIENEQVYYIKDNGAGFDMQYYNKLFGVFQRLHASTEFEGTGVGLALVKRIINRHGGKIWAEGVLNEGATFYFTLNNN